MKLSVFRNRTYLAVFFAALLGICALVYVTADRFDRRFDMSAEGRFTLSEQSRNVLDRIDAPVDILVFYHADQRAALAQFKVLLESYRVYTDKIRLDYLELDREPLRASEYGVERYGEVIVAGPARAERLTDWTEESVTNALLRIREDVTTPIYFTQDHGEVSLHGTERNGFSRFRDALTAKHYRPMPLLLSEGNAVPEDANVIIIASPKTDFFPEELEKLDAFLARGGALVVLSDPNAYRKVNTLESFLLQFGIRIGQDVVVDRLSAEYGNDAVMPIVDQFAAHPVRRGFKGHVTLAMARSVRPTAATRKLTELTVLAAASKESWAETDIDGLEGGRATYDEKDGTYGRVPVAALAEGRVAGEHTGGTDVFRVLVLGDSDFLTNALLRVSGNRDFMLSAVAWLSSRDELVSIESDPVRATPLYLRKRDRQRLFLSMVLGLPLTVLLLGFWMRIRRAQYV